jgi:hypothetical protein
MACMPKLAIDLIDTTDFEWSETRKHLRKLNFDFSFYVKVTVIVKLLYLNVLEQDPSYTFIICQTLTNS